MNHTICDITKLAKISKTSITLHGKVNIKSTGSIVDVIMKVYSDSRKINDKLYAYSRNIYKEEKEILPDVYPNTIDSDPFYLEEHIVYYKDDNIVIIKMFKYCKTIEQMIKSFPNKRNSFFVELLALYGDIKKRDNSLWQNTACTMKNIIWHNGKWIFLSTICCPGYCQRKGMEADNILAIIDLFKSYGMTNEELMNGVKQQMLSNYYFPCIFSQLNGWNWTMETRSFPEEINRLSLSLIRHHSRHISSKSPETYIYKTMEDFIDNSEKFYDDFYINNYKSGGKSAKNYYKKPKSADNKTSNLLKKIQSLPISKQSKESLTKLVINHTISDITKLVKISKRSVTLHGKVKIKPKLPTWFYLEDNVEKVEDVIIKVYCDSCGNSNELYAYSRNIFDEKKPKIYEDFPKLIQKDSAYLRENIILYSVDNVSFIKMFKDCKTLEQMIKSFPNNRNAYYIELLWLYKDIKKRDGFFWNNKACTMKNILWHNGKWIFLSTNCSTGHCNYQGLESDNLLKIIELFSIIEDTSLANHLKLTTVKTMKDFIDNSEEFYDDFYINNYKSGGKSVKKYYKKPKSADNKTSNLLKKIQSLPISKQSKESLTKLVINHTISDITKLIKISKRSVTLHGKVNIRNIGSVNDVIIKVYCESCGNHNELYAYSRNIYDEKKPEIYDKYPRSIQTDSDYIRENIILYKVDNVAFIKMFKDCKTIEQMIKSSPTKKNAHYIELLGLYKDVKRRDWYFWQNNACTMKNILWHNGKWVFLSTNCSTGHCYHQGSESDNLLKIIELFKSYGMSNEELKKGLKEQNNLDSFPQNFKKKDFYDKHFPM
ncbi:unnamed protein product [Chironomus riparius]|uniref:Uncharacterized protein n=1 Tax=Chironomus riparius TaxID=315576 RepID=A0A9N9RL16_9DIPT|nr:unnamed protein product [Chironomus riparius]